MKFLFFIAIFSFTAFAGTQECIRDAKDYGEKLYRFNREACGKSILKESRKIVAYSRSKGIRASGLDNIVVIERMNPTTQKVTRTDVLAGEQTGLGKLKRIWVDEENEVMVVLQKNKTYELLTFTLAYASNTAPLRHFTSSILNDVNEVRYLKKEGKIALISTSQKSIRFINADADNVRYHTGQFKPLLWGEISGTSTKLNAPNDLVMSSDSKLTYVLDQGKVLSFDYKDGKMTTPRNMKPMSSASKGSYLENYHGEIYLVGPAGREKVTL